MSFRNFQVPFTIDDRYTKKAAYFPMDVAVHQPLKTYSGGLGFLAGSHMRSAYELEQNVVGIGMLWENGYYDQGRDLKAGKKPFFVEKDYSFLQDTGIMFTVPVHDSLVYVKAYLLHPETFGSAPIFLLTT